MFFFFVFLYSFQEEIFKLVFFLISTLEFRSLFRYFFFLRFLRIFLLYRGGYGFRDVFGLFKVQRFSVGLGWEFVFLGFEMSLFFFRLQYIFGVIFFGDGGLVEGFGDRRVQRLFSGVAYGFKFIFFCFQWDLRFWILVVGSWEVGITGFQWFLLFLGILFVFWIFLGDVRFR